MVRRAHQHPGYRNEFDHVSVPERHPPRSVIDPAILHIVSIFPQMVSARAKTQPKSSPQTSLASTPKAGRRLTPASATPVKGQRRQPISKKAGPGKKPLTDHDDNDDSEELTGSDEASSSDDNSGDAFDPESSASEEELLEEDEESEVDSDFLDEDEADKSKRKAKGGSRGRINKKARPSAISADDEEEEHEADVELAEGQVIAGRIYPAPTTGQGELIVLTIC